MDILGSRWRWQRKGYARGEEGESETYWQSIDIQWTGWHLELSGKHLLWKAMTVVCRLTFWLLNKIFCNPRLCMRVRITPEKFITFERKYPILFFQTMYIAQVVYFFPGHFATLWDRIQLAFGLGLCHKIWMKIPL